MGKRVYITLAVVAAALVSVSLWKVAWPRETEPVYEGKPLTTWMKLYAKSAGLNNDDVLHVEQAVRQAGTNAIPTLLRLLRVRDSALEVKFMPLLQRQRIIKIEQIPANDWNLAAFHGFKVLGSKAREAVPALMKIVDQNISRSSQYYAILALGNIGPPAKGAVPSLIGLVTNTNADFRARCVGIIALHKIQTESGVFVPVLITALHDPEPPVIANALDTLGFIGPDAMPAVPALVELLNAPDKQFFRSHVTKTLKAIDPDAAAKAGITDHVP